MIDHPKAKDGSSSLQRLSTTVWQQDNYRESPAKNRIAHCAEHAWLLTVQSRVARVSCTELVGVCDTAHEGKSTASGQDGEESKE